MQTFGRPQRIFDECYEPDPNSGCWLWSAALGSDDYPIFRKQRAARWVLVNIHGEEPGDWLACHKCNTKECVNPHHLYAGTPQENMRDAQVAGTFERLHEARDRQWAAQTTEERRARVSKGVQGIRSWWADKNPEERSQIARERALARWRPTIQTFLPHPNMAVSVAVLDRARLGKQRMECRQILGAIQNGGGWRNHPAVKMWQYHQRALMLYHDVCIREWLRRGYKNEMPEFGVAPDTVTMPPWMGDDAFHSAHRASLLAKDPAHYGALGWAETPMQAYRWPMMRTPAEYELTELR